jgi:hypothetical protein
MPNMAATLSRTTTTTSPTRANGAALGNGATAPAELKLLPPHSPPAEVMDAVERLAHAAERAAAARFELALHKATSTAKEILKAFGLTGGALLLGLSAWIFVVVGAALVLAPHVGGGWAALIVGGVQLVFAGALFFLAKKTTDKVTQP